MESASGGSELTVLGTRHATDDGIDVRAFAFDFVDVEAPPGDAVLADAHDDDATLVERCAVRLGSVQWISAKTTSPSTAERSTSAWKSATASSSADQFARTWPIPSNVRAGNCGCSLR